MKKRLLPIFFLILLTFGLALPVSAAENSIDDDAQLLTPDQINQLKQEIQPLEEKTKASVFIVTTNNNTYGDEQEYADHYLLNKVGKDQNAILFLIDMDLRKVYISTSGNMIDYMTGARIDDTLDKVMDGVSQGNYFAAAQTFVQETQTFVDKGVPGGHYRVDSETGKITRYKVITPLEMVIAFAAALILSLVFLGINISKYQLKFSSYQYPFSEKTTLNLTSRTDQLTNSFITTRRIPKNNGGSGGMGGGGSTTHSTGGGTFGGGGRSF